MNLRKLFPVVPVVLVGGIGVVVGAVVMADVVPLDTTRMALCLVGSVVGFGLMMWSSAMGRVQQLELERAWLVGNANFLELDYFALDEEYERLVAAARTLADGVKAATSKAPDSCGEYLVPLGQWEQELRGVLPGRDTVAEG